MKWIPSLAVLFLLSCSTAKVSQEKSSTENNITVNGKLFTALYMQRAAEYRALCFQAYNYARLKLDRTLLTDDNGKRPAIVTDIDETLLDNSPFAVHQGLQNKEYEVEKWYEWTAKSAADTIPGACSFLQYAKSKGYDIFYITNRDEVERAATLANLNKFNFPDADNAHLFLREKTSSKEVRRVRVAQDHEIVLLLGDNLADFSSLWDKKGTEERIEKVQSQWNEFGNRFIVIPNPNYGDWESSLYQYNYKLTPGQKDSVIKSVLKGY